MKKDMTEKGQRISSKQQLLQIKSVLDLANRQPLSGR